MRRGVLGLDLLPGVGDPMCPWKVNANGDYEWERCSSDCKVVGQGGSQPGQEISLIDLFDIGIEQKVPETIANSH